MNVDTNETELRARNLRTVFALAALFLLPVAFAYLLYYGSDWRPPGSASHGELLRPVRMLPEIDLPVVDAGTNPSDASTASTLREKWSLVYIGAGSCDEACRHALYIMRQSRLLLNKDMTRAQRAFLVTADCCDNEFLAREHAGLVVLDASGSDGQELLSAFPQGARENSIFIVDPLGNLIMRHDARQDPKGLLEDLRRLLRLSQIG